MIMKDSPPIRSFLVLQMIYVTLAFLCQNHGVLCRKGLLIIKVGGWQLVEKLCDVVKIYAYFR